MGTREGESDVEDGPDQEVGSHLGQRPEDAVTMLTHFYRAEVERTTTWRQRLDESTYWAVTVMAALLTWAFSSEDNPHFVLLVGMLAVTLFLVVETRRYRTYDAWRSRVRMLQEDFFATALAPDDGVEHQQWRERVSDDLRAPKLKISIRQALTHRLRRIYAALLTIMLAAWLFKIVGYTSNEGMPEGASIGTIPGVAVVTVVGLFYAGVLALTLWPLPRHGKREFDEDGGTPPWRDRD